MRAIIPIMLFVLRACALQVQLPTPTPQAESGAAYTTNRTVTRGQSFTANLAPNLTVHLLPLDHGWENWVGDSTYSIATTANFTMPVTSSFHTINARMIEGWHFRNNDNGGPNTAGNLVANQQAWLESISFTVTLNPTNRVSYSNSCLTARHRDVGKVTFVAIRETGSGV